MGDDCDKDDVCGGECGRQINYTIEEDDLFKKNVLVFAFQIVVSLNKV